MMGLTELGRYLEVARPGEASELVMEAVQILRWKLQTQHLPSFLRSSKYSVMHHSNSHQLVDLSAETEQIASHEEAGNVLSWMNTIHIFTVRFIPFERPPIAKLDASQTSSVSNRDLHLAIHLENHGYANQRARKHSEAAAAFGEALFLRQRHFAKLFNSSKSQKKSVSEKEIAQFEEALIQNTERYAYSLVYSNQTDEAIVYLQDAVTWRWKVYDADPSIRHLDDYCRSLVALLSSYEIVGLLEDACRFWDANISFIRPLLPDPQSPDQGPLSEQLRTRFGTILHHAATASHCLSRAEEAHSYFEEACTRLQASLSLYMWWRPGNNGETLVRCLNEYGYSLCTQGMYEEAVERLEEALVVFARWDTHGVKPDAIGRVRWNQACILRNISWCYLRLERVDESVEVLEKAISMLPVPLTPYPDFDFELDFPSDEEQITFLEELQSMSHYLIAPAQGVQDATTSNEIVAPLPNFSFRCSYPSHSSRLVSTLTKAYPTSPSLHVRTCGKPAYKLVHSEALIYRLRLRVEMGDEII